MSKFTQLSVCSQLEICLSQYSNPESHSRTCVFKYYEEPKSIGPLTEYAHKRQKLMTSMNIVL